jgi:hypothetical protein
MTDVRPDDVAADPAASVPAPADQSAPAPDAQPTLDDSLAEYERATAQPEPTAQPAANYDEIDKLLEELSKPGGAPLDGSPLFGQQVSDAQQQVQAEQQRAVEQLSALQSENAQLRAYAQRAVDQADFGKLTSEVQSRLPSHLPEDFAVTALKSMAVDRPELVLAFDTRHVDRRAVAAELRQVEAALFWQQRNPSAADPGYAAQLQQYRGQLNVALHGREILNRAVREVVQRGQAHRPIDPEATEMHDVVAAAVRGASGKASPEPPPNFGQMSDRQLREYTKTNFGF